MKAMRMFVAAIAAMMVMTSCAKSVKKEISKEYQVAAFTKIDCEGVANIIYKQADTYQVYAEGDSVLLSNTIIEVSDGCLKIDQKKTTKNKSKIDVYVSAPILSEVETEGVGSFEAKDPIVFDNDFKFESEGVGSVKIADLTCRNFKFHQEGVGSSAVKVKCQKATCENEGVGSASIEIEADSLTLVSEGVGTVKVKGHVKHYTSKGGGIVSKISDKNLIVGE